MTLEFKLRNEPQTSVDVFGIVPDKTSNLSTHEIGHLTITVGNQSAEFAEFFDVSGNSSDQHQVWQGDLNNVNGIGHQLSNGWIQIDGNAGNHVGSQMTGGTLQIKGNVGDNLGAEMTGGLIQVRGDVGNMAGAAYLGSKFGQNGGSILIEG